MPRAPRPHVARVRILECREPSCQADETGCMSSGCRGPRWSWLPHDQFRERYGRCPAACAAPDPSPPPSTLVED